MKEGKKAEKVIEHLRRLQADSIVLYMKVHNYHWNVRGIDFPAAHKALEGIYDDFADMFDDLAERIVQLDGTPVVTLAEALKLTKIKEESKTSFTSKEVLKEVLKIYKHLHEDFESLAKLADKDDDRVTASYCDDKLASLEKAIWMTNAQLA
ncbi:DNA starvation/stationary phase protection protein [Helicobacter sp. CLO-3]|uniref:Dps family protein n=1 Tax=unclassified Helicobacter TaxID=2593540 RepID=UPI0008054401|nr:MULTISPECIES: DNA starvation/stationary phase protection protein [unclassified Helicobacter]OBV28335.1 DNA starvation/stationary phase protection protein [Helicobacter sp. CLO-3]OHU84526.1 DNA starvation/stationary phase protection protein [Helicobacter sp. CLO-3]